MKYTVLTRYGAMRSIGAFATDIKNLRLGDRCVVRSERGTEWGEIIGDPLRVEGRPGKIGGTILRRATPKDYERRQQLEDVEQPKESTFCAERIKERELPMRLVSAEHIMGGEKIIFYFLAEGRVDFRELVKDLATEYKTRIELRQIGVRDEARLLAEYEHCGRELCCRTFMKDLEPVTMRMAKLQKTTLDPAKISGRCGRLMCCLRFEDETYACLKKNLPKKGTRVRIQEGAGEVVSSEILAQRVTIELPGRRTVKVALPDILEVLPEEEPKKLKQEENVKQPDGDRSEGRPSRGRRRSGGRGKRRRGGARQPRQDAPRGKQQEQQNEPRARPEQRGTQQEEKRQDKPPRAPKPAEPRQEAVPEAKPEAMQEAKPEAKQEAKPEAKQGDWVADEWWEEPDAPGE